ncbi:MAG: hypothetical protein AB4050_20355 [Synechococcus sp.]
MGKALCSFERLEYCDSCAAIGGSSKIGRLSGSSGEQPASTSHGLAGDHLVRFFPHLDVPVGKCLYLAVLDLQAISNAFFIAV